MSMEVVISGIGAISPLGLEKERFFRAFEAEDIPPGERGEMAGMEPGKLTAFLGIRNPKLKIARYLDPTAKNLIVAMENAMADAGIGGEDISADPYGYAILLGAVRGPKATRLKAYEMMRAKEGKMLSSTLFSNFGYNIAGAMAAIAHGVKGPNLTISGKADLSLSLFRRARTLLQAGRAHTVFCGYSEADTETFDPQRPFRESACIFCLETKERALRRGRAKLFRVGETPTGNVSDPPSRTGKEGPFEGEFSKGMEGGGNYLGVEEEFIPLIRLGMLVSKPERIARGQDCRLPVETRTGGAFLTLAPAP